MGNVFNASSVKAALVWLCICIVLCDARILSRDKFLELREELKSLNKPAVKTIKTEDGDIFDCVDIHKQPALDHPLLKNHIVQTKPTFFPLKEATISSSRSRVEIGLPGGGCPDGTVPIERVQMEDLVRAHSTMGFQKEEFMNQFSRKVLHRTNHTFVHIATTHPGHFYGAKAVMNLWNPHIRNDHQYSSAQIRLINGAHGPVNVIEAGWTVNRAFYNDSVARIFGYWTADGYQKTGCLNYQCGGFIQAHKYVNLGARFRNYSTSGGDQIDITVSVTLDARNNWWLSVDRSNIGYWPMEIFTQMSDFDTVMWGGQVSNPDKADPMPEMGSGHWSTEGWKKACYMRNLQTLRFDREFIDAPTDTDIQIDRPKCYSVTDKGNSGPWRRHFYFGGPGGQCNSARS